METSLHRTLKQRYAGPAARTEVRLGRFRIDVVRGDELVEIQHGSLAAIRRKVGALLNAGHRVRVVKPIIAHKLLVKRNKKGGPVASRRQSPKRGCLLDLFDELIYFTRLFPHPRLVIEAVLVDVEEWRRPGHGRRRRRRDTDHVVEDQHLAAVHAVRVLATAADLRSIVPAELPAVFHTGHLAESLAVRRWVAQRIAYCWRQAGTTQVAGKQGNTWLYEFAQPRTARLRPVA